MIGKPGKTVRTGFGDEVAVPVIDMKRCTRCGLCVLACKSFTIIDAGGMPRVAPDNGLGCIGCGHCMAVCPADAVTVSGRRLSPEDAFPLPPKAARATPGALEALLVSRRSVREFSGREVGKQAVERILAMAASAPMGIPPTDVGVTVINGRERVQDLAADIVSVFGKWRSFFNPVVMKAARLFMGRYDAEMMRDFILPVIGMIIDARKGGADYLFYHAPCVLLFHQSPYADPVDGQIACTYAMIAAESMGLGTCMIGTVAHALNMEKKLKEKWRIPVLNKTAIGMILGYPAFRYRRGIRRGFAGVHYA